MKRMVACIVGVIAISNVFSQTVIDVDGNTYKTVKIGRQTWMAENLKTTKYSDGTAIPNVPDATAWSNLSSGAYCNYDNRASNAVMYGCLYNWYVVKTGKLCPVGWHVPTEMEWTRLYNYLLEGSYVAGGKLKETGTTHWSIPNDEATNSSGFTALPSGCRYGYSGSFNGSGYGGYWWSSFRSHSGKAYNRYLYYKNSDLDRGYDDKRSGFSVRCVKD